MNYSLYNEDCIIGASKIPDNSVDLIICDPPFGINEGGFDEGIYRREWDVGADKILSGYVEAPSNYRKFTFDWLSQAKRILKPNGTIYIISGWNRLGDVLQTVETLKLIELNHLIWKYNFGVVTTLKFVSSHYHILRLGKSKKVKFNTYCRFGPQEKRTDGKGSALYADMEDVFMINKEYHPGKIKNKNKLPDELIRKLILYSSNPGDSICDFFMGNFTTAYQALKLGRKVIGFELNKIVYDHHLPLINQITFGCDLKSLKKVLISKPVNAGKPMDEMEQAAIIKQYAQLKNKMTKKNAIVVLCQEFGRGRFSIYNVIKSTHQH